MTMPSTIRRINETRLVDALFRSGAMSRADLARMLGLTRATAGNLVSGLVRKGMLLERDKSLTPRGARTGRPGGAVRLNPDYAIFLGAEIGVDQITVMALNAAAEPLVRLKQPMPKGRSDPQEVVQSLKGMLQDVAGQLAAEQVVRGLAVTIPGLLNHDGTVLRAPILGWKQVPLRALLASALPQFDSIRVENDGNASAFAEIYRNPEGGSRELEDTVYLFMDSGVGGGIFANGALVTGSNGYAGEVGHILVGESGFGPLLTVRGSLESYVGRQALLSRYQQHGGTAVSFEALIAAAQEGDDAALATFADCVPYLARGLATLTSVLNPGKFVLGGAVAAFFAQDPKKLQSAIQENLLPDHPLPKLQFSSLGADGPVVGAACLMHQAFFALPKPLESAARQV